MNHSISSEQITIEEMFVKTFIANNRQRRYLELLHQKSEKARRKFTDMLHHSLFRDIPLGVHAQLLEHRNGFITVENLYILLKSHGAPEECIITSCTDMDGKRILLKDALHEVVGANIGDILHCVPGKLALYCSEGMDYFLCRKT